MSPEGLAIISLTCLSGLLIVLLLLKGRKKEQYDGSILLGMGRNLEQLDRLVRQVDEMNRVFHSPRLRGGLGEVLLEDMIRNRLPKGAYDFQHPFSGGQRADAVIRMGSYKVAVDAKFPLEQMAPLFEGGQQDIPRSVEKVFLKHGRDIAEKYILPREGTLPFAIMYIPSENLYYRIFVAGSAGLQEELLNMGILPAGPSSLFSYLQTVLYGFKGFNFSSRSREMMRLTGQIRKEFEVLNRQWKTAGTHLKNFQNAWDESGKSLGALERNIRGLDDKGDG